MVSHQNDLTVFLTRPVSAVILLVSALMVAWPGVAALRRRLGVRARG
jgi:TctA family transporter